VALGLVKITREIKPAVPPPPRFQNPDINNVDTFYKINGPDVLVVVQA